MIWWGATYPFFISINFQFFGSFWIFGIPWWLKVDEDSIGWMSRFILQAVDSAGMKFCKNLFRVVELSDPEWGPYWMNYKFLKKKINDIVLEQGGSKGRSVGVERRDPNQLSKSASEVEFFRVLKYELKKTSDFFAMSEDLYKIRHRRVLESYQFLKDSEVVFGITFLINVFILSFFAFSSFWLFFLNLLCYIVWWR